MAPRLDKAALLAELTERLGTTLAAARAAHQAAIEGATHAEAKAENDKDTRGLEQSYLARGQATRVAELEAGLAALAALDVAPVRVAAVGALVEVSDDDGGHHRYFLAPQGGGELLAGGAVQVVTPRSPLGQALLGRRAGDESELRLPGHLRMLEIVAVD